MIRLVRRVAPARSAGATGARRQHGVSLHPDRRELERDGWRTTVEYRENHVRGRNGRLRQLQVEWHVSAEREGSAAGAVGAAGASVPVVIEAAGSTLDKAWSRLRFQADLADVRPAHPPSEGAGRQGTAGAAVARSIVPA